MSHLKRTINRWFPDSVYCHLSKRDCANCPVNRIYSLKYECKMPQSVDILLEKEVQMPNTLKNSFYSSYGSQQP